MGRAARTIDATEVPCVEPQQMIAAFAIVQDWIEDLDTAPSAPFEASELFFALGEIKQQLDVTPMAAVALFKRSLALLALCAEVDLPHELFEDGLPGPSLSIAASQTQVVNRGVLGTGNCCPCFDPGELQSAFRLALN